MKLKKMIKLLLFKFGLMGGYQKSLIINIKKCYKSQDMEYLKSLIRTLFFLP